MKNDPIIRMLIIVILGTIAFGLLFNMFTGGGTDMEDMYTTNLSNGTSINVFLANLLVLLVKFLMIVLVLAIIIGVILWIKNNFFKDTHFNYKQSMQQDPFFKMLIGISVFVIGIMLVFWVLNNFISPGLGSNMGNVYGYNMNGYDMNGTSMNGYNMNGTSMNGYNMNGYDMTGSNGYGLNTSLGLTSVFSLLIKVLSYIFIISLILALVAYLKKLYEAGNLNFLKTINPINVDQTTTSPINANQENNQNKPE